MVGVTARDVMSREFVGVSEGDAVDDVVDLFVEQSADDVLVLRGSDPVGVVTCHDLLAAVGDDEREQVEDVMSEPPAPVRAEDDLGTVLAQLSSAPADVLPVADADDELVGVVTDADVIAAATSLVSEPNGVDAATAEPGQTATDAGADASGPGAAPIATGASAQADPEATTQGLCESCGSLTADLQVVNGQSICPKCRDV